MFNLFSGRYSLFFATIALVLSLLSAGCVADPAWDGEYFYEESYGETYGGSVMIRNYTVSIDGGNCELIISGYQTYKVLLCIATPEGDALALSFKSYGSGKVVNRRGVKEYEVGEQLLRFEHDVDTGELLTHWFNLKTLDKSKRGSGNYFKKVVRESME